MKPNKDIALEKIYTDYVWDISNLPDEGKVVDVKDVEELIKLASKPDWYYPSKGEFPKHNEKIIVVISKNSYPAIYATSHFRHLNRQGFNDTIEAWTYLPKFEEDD
ncbi:MAG: hypothetical protein GY775_16715 [Candidatus Scalindua sp.]|nr:hypothetical protein [Candidatus Scalindua sp.]